MRMENVGWNSSITLLAMQRESTATFAITCALRLRNWADRFCSGVLELSSLAWFCCVWSQSPQKILRSVISRQGSHVHIHFPRVRRAHRISRLDISIQQMSQELVLAMT